MGGKPGAPLNLSLRDGVERRTGVEGVRRRGYDQKTFRYRRLRIPRPSPPPPPAAPRSLPWHLSLSLSLSSPPRVRLVIVASVGGGALRSPSAPTDSTKKKNETLKISPFFGIQSKDQHRGGGGIETCRDGDGSRSAFELRITYEYLLFKGNSLATAGIQATKEGAKFWHGSFRCWGQNRRGTSSPFLSLSLSLSVCLSF